MAAARAQKKNPKAQQNSDSEEEVQEKEEPKEETKVEEPEENSDSEEEDQAPQAPTMIYCPGKFNPIFTLFCLVCSMPPEYCEFASDSLDQCKTWLEETHEELYESIWAREGADEVKGKKKKKKVAFKVSADAEIRVVKMKRGGKKMQSLIIGLEAYGIKIAEAAKALSKRMATGAVATESDYKGISYNCI